MLRESGHIVQAHRDLNIVDAAVLLLYLVVLGRGEILNIGRL